MPRRCVRARAGRRCMSSCVCVCVLRRGHGEEVRSGKGSDGTGLRRRGRVLRQGSNPANAATPENPATPANPATSENAANPATPATPTNAANPATPANQSTEHQAPSCSLRSEESSRFSGSVGASAAVFAIETKKGRRRATASHTKHCTKYDKLLSFPSPSCATAAMFAVGTEREDTCHSKLHVQTSKRPNIQTSKRPNAETSKRRLPSLPAHPLSA
eukprot:353854-Chlamydomonas_euryale.AAC.1